MQHVRKIEAVSKAPRFTVGLAGHADAVRDAQRLRWRVFAEEQGAQLDTPTPGLDIDAFDETCAHLIVRDCITQAVVGTYRILQGSASRGRGFYAAQKFDLQALDLDHSRTVEIGRACVDSAYRNGAVIALLWSGIAAFLQGGRFTSLIGCASICARDGGHRAASIYAQLCPSRMSLADRRVVPFNPLPLACLDASGDPTPPPLVKAYLRSGAKVCGTPAFDRAFGTADLFMMLDVNHLSQRHAQHFLRPNPKLEVA